MHFGVLRHIAILTTALDQHSYTIEVDFEEFVVFIDSFLDILSASASSVMFGFTNTESVSP